MSESSPSFEDYPGFVEYRTPEHQKSELPPLSVHFIPGLLASEKSMRPLREETAKLGGVDAQIWNSTVSTDEKKEDRLKGIAGAILASLKLHEDAQDGGKTLIGGFSLAGGELPLIWDEMMKADPELVKRNFKDIHIMGWSLAGLNEGPRAFLGQLRNYIDVVRSQFGSPLAEKVPNELAGIESLDIFDSPLLAGLDMTNVLRRFLPDRSSFKEGLDVLNYTPLYTNVNNLPPQVRVLLDVLDLKIRALAESASEIPSQVERSQMEQFLKDRGKLLAPFGMEAYEPKREDDTAPVKQSLGQVAIALLGIVGKENRRIVRAIYAGRAGKLFDQLVQQGFPEDHIHYVLGEYDAFTTLKDLVDGYPKLPQETVPENVTVVERSTHASWSAGGETFARTIDHLRRKIAA